MSSRVGRKKGLLVGGLAVVALLVFTALPGMAASNRFVSLEVTPTEAPAATGVPFKAKVTNTSPVGSVSNPNSVRVTVPTGFTVTNTVTDPPTLSTPASGESSNANPSKVISWTTSNVTVNSLQPLQRGQFVTINLTVMTSDITCPATEGESGAWKAAGSTSSTFGQGQSFSQRTTDTPQVTHLTKSCDEAPGPITIDVVTPVTQTPPVSVTYVVGDTVTFYASTVTGVPTPDITWQSSTDNFASDICSGDSCSFEAALTNDGASYQATASNNSGTTTSNVIQITVFEETIPCGGTLNDTGGGTNVDVTLVNTDGCEPKAISIDATSDDGGNRIEVLTGGSGVATFVVYSNDWAPEPAQSVVPPTSVSPVTPTDPGPEDEVLCLGTYDPDDDDFATGGTLGASMPEGHTWCRILQTSVIAGGSTEFPLMVVTEIHLLEGDAAACRRCG